MCLDKNDIRQNEKDKTRVVIKCLHGLVWIEYFVAEACFPGSETSSGFRKVLSIFRVRSICCDLVEYLFYSKLWKQDFSHLQNINFT